MVICCTAHTSPERVVQWFPVHYVPLINKYTTPTLIWFELYEPIRFYNNAQPSRRARNWILSNPLQSVWKTLRNGSFPWGSAPLLPSSANPSLYAPLKAACLDFTAWIQLTPCMARMIFLWSGSSWPILETSITHSTVLPNHDTWSTFLNLDFSIFFLHFPLLSSEKGRSVIKAHQPLSVYFHRDDSMAQHALKAPAKVLLTERQQFVCKSGFECSFYWEMPAGEMQGKFSLHYQHPALIVSYLQSFCPEKKRPFLSYAYLCSAVTILQRNGEQFSSDGWF